jgi:hypothetical protein
VLDHGRDDDDVGEQRTPVGEVVDRPSGVAADHPDVVPAGPVGEGGRADTAFSSAAEARRDLQAAPRCTLEYDDRNSAPVEDLGEQVLRLSVTATKVQADGCR